MESLLVARRILPVVALMYQVPHQDVERMLSELTPSMLLEVMAAEMIEKLGARDAGELQPAQRWAGEDYSGDV